MTEVVDFAHQIAALPIRCEKNGNPRSKHCQRHHEAEET